MDWLASAACVHHDPELFFPVGRSMTYEVRRALNVCKTCPVQAECLDLSRKVTPTVGIWGGRWYRQKTVNE